MPICALAAAMARSEAAMSGRRSSNCDGRPTGTGGGVAVRYLVSIAKFEGTLPTRTAMACSYWARKTPRLVAVASAFCNVFVASTTAI